MYLVGSRAINYYTPIGRPVKDWDLWVETSRSNQIIQGELIDFHEMTISEQELINQLPANLPQLSSPVGSVFVTPLWLNLLLKTSHYSLNKKVKHIQDMELLAKLPIEKPLGFDQWLLTRFLETEKKQANFFEGDIVRHIPHDLLHLWVAQALGQSLPTFSHLLPGEEYIIAEDKFKQLSYQDQLNLAIEEILVLGLERWFIYHLVKTPGSLIKKWELFCSHHSPAIEYCERMGVRGRIKKHPDYLADWIQENYSQLISMIPEKLNKIKVNMPDIWWQTLIKIRKANLGHP